MDKTAPRPQNGLICLTVYQGNSPFAKSLPIFTKNRTVLNMHTTCAQPVSRMVVGCLVFAQPINMCKTGYNLRQHCSIFSKGRQTFPKQTTHTCVLHWWCTGACIPAGGGISTQKRNSALNMVLSHRAGSIQGGVMQSRAVSYSANIVRRYSCVLSLFII